MIGQGKGSLGAVGAAGGVWTFPGAAVWIPGSGTAGVAAGVEAGAADVETDDGVGSPGAATAPVGPASRTAASETDAAAAREKLKLVPFRECSITVGRDEHDLHCSRH